MYWGCEGIVAWCRVLATCYTVHMIERMGNDVRRKSFEYPTNSAEQLPSRNRERNIPREEPAREDLVAAATPRMTTEAALKKAALGAGIVVGAPVAATLLSSVLTVIGVHKLMDKLSEKIAKPLTEWIISLGALNPFKKVWNWIVGGEGGGGSHAHAAHDHHHGGGHDHGHH